MNDIKEKILKLNEEILNTVDTLEKMEDKRALVSWIANYWTNGIRQIAAYTAVPPEMRAKARETIELQYKQFEKASKS